MHIYRESNTVEEKATSLKKQARERSVSIGLPLALRALSLTILRVNHFYGACAGRLLWWTKNETKNIARINIKIAFPELSIPQQENLLKKSLMELGKTVTELGPLWMWNRKKLMSKIADVEGQHHLDAAFKQGKGVIVLAPHAGAWELMGLYLSIQHSITSLYRPPRLSSVEKFTRRARERFGAQLVPTDIRGVRALRRTLAENKLIGVLPDQDPGESGGIQAPFFGYSARTMLLVSRLAARTGAPLVFAVAERLSKGKGYRLHFTPANPDVASNDDKTAAQALNEGVEDIIRMNPAQYQWSYKRFKNTAEDQPDPYGNVKRAA